MKQQTLTGFEKYAKTTRRAQFLADMDQIIPWPELAAAMRSFVGIDLGVEGAPDETTVCKFHPLLERNKLGKVLLTAVNDYL